MDPFTKKDAIYIKSHNSEFSDIVIDIQSKWQINNIRYIFYIVILIILNNSMLL